MEQKNLANSEVNQLTIEISILKQQTAQNIIEIGKRLIKAKEILPHGEWGRWLEEKVDFTRQTAHKFMKIAEEYSNVNAHLHLGTTKLFNLLELPEGEREQFVKDNDVEKMSTRELQQAIKEREQAIKEKQELEKRLQSAEKDANTNKHLYETVSESYNRLEETNRKHYEKSETLRKELEETKNQLVEAQATGNTELVDQLQESLQKTEKDLQESAEKIKELERQLKEKPMEVEAFVERVPEEVKRELDELRKKNQEFEAKIQQGAQANEATLNYTVYFNSLVKGFKDLLGALEEIKKTDAQEYERYKNAVIKLMRKMSEHL